MNCENLEQSTALTLNILKEDIYRMRMKKSVIGLDIYLINQNIFAVIESRQNTIMFFQFPIIVNNCTDNVDYQKNYHNYN